MKKQFFLRLIEGAMLGLCIYIAISVGISAGIGDGNYYPASELSVAYWGSEYAATLFGIISSLLFGAVCGTASLVWDISKWSLTRQTIVNCALMTGASFPFMWFNFFVPHTTGLIITWFATFIGVYAIIWVCVYLGMRARIRRINTELEGKRSHLK